jgi:N-acetylglucosaminyldiphosphoundecaprenol N-acetyl-beta-D-mannosaminyltransferase
MTVAAHVGKVILHNRAPLTPSYEILGIKLTPSTAQELLAIVTAHVETREPAVIASQNMHGLYVHLGDPDFRRLHAAANTYVHLDGMPLVLLCRLAGLSVSTKHRVTWVDFIDPLLSLADRNRWSVYYLGGDLQTVSAGLSILRDRYPRATFYGHHGYFEDGSATHEGIVEEIQTLRPELLLLGMGMGRQERWIFANRHLINVPVTFTTGACLEYVAGRVRTPPRWLGRSGLEWAFRLCENPLRFCGRYLIEPWIVCGVLLGRYVTLARVPNDE